MAEIDKSVVVTVSASDIVAAVNSAFSLALQLYSSLKQVSGEEEIPSWESIVADNMALQAKIDAEKEA